MKRSKTNPNRRELFKTAAGLAAAGIVQGKTGPASLSRTEWLYQAKWGIGVHFVHTPANATIDSWNKRVDKVNVDQIADQVASAGAGYMIFTIGQGTSFFCSPNSTYDSILGTVRCSKRDLIQDLAVALQRRKLKLIAYLPAGGPDFDSMAASRLGWVKEGVPSQDFQAKWEAILEEFGDRWQSNCAGWWFDGVYSPNIAYRGGTHNFGTFSAAARKGFPGRILAFNGGVDLKIRPLCEYDDYTAGEEKDPAGVVCPGRIVDGAQFHMFSHLGSDWGHGEPKFSDDQCQAISRAIVSKGGVVTWDVPPAYTGELQPDFIRQLQSLRSVISSAR